MNNAKISFWDFISTHKVVIPIIQRDYAQGRKGKEELRKGFLTNLKQALDNKLPNDEEYLKLDFVYGATDDQVLYPLDGQQRLTTLWLLHWFIALRAGELNEANCKILSRFSYETRVSSREFCERMCNPIFFEDYKPEHNSIVKYIEEQIWFYSAWKQDPTIQSMLRMLEGTREKNKAGEDFVDGIEELFNNNNRDAFVNYWNLLTKKSPIVFYHLPLEKFGLSDDLYIKMNARGKQLSAFENFKADLIGFIKGQDGEEWNNLIDEGRGLPTKLDTAWTDIFWRKKSKNNRIDEAYFVFIIRFFWNELFNAKNKDGKYILKVGEEVGGDGVRSSSENKNVSYRLFNADNPQLYNGFEPYCYYNKSIPFDFFKNLEKVLDGYMRLTSALPSCSWDKNFQFIPGYKEKEGFSISSLTQIQRVVFYSICKFFKDLDYGEDISLVQLSRWMRVVWNLVSDFKDGGSTPQIRSTTAMRKAMEFIESLNSHNVYESLTEKKVNNTDAFDVRCWNEIIKARKMVEEDGSLRKYDGSIPEYQGKTWEDVIVEAENFAFFRGTIHFLYMDEKGEENWDYFDEKWENATKLLLNTVDNWEIICNLIGYIGVEVLRNYHDSFTANDDFWRKWLFDINNSVIIHHFLMQDGSTQDTRLNKDISAILLRTKSSMKILHDWKNCQMVLTNYNQRRDVFKNGYVYVVNTPRNRFIYELLYNNQYVTDIMISNAWGDDYIEENGNRHYRGLYVDFSYGGRMFRLYERDVVELRDNIEYGSNIILEEGDDVASFNTKIHNYINDTMAEKSTL